MADDAGVTSFLDPGAFSGTDPRGPYSSPHKLFWMSALDCFVN
jgi:hypothetical protein